MTQEDKELLLKDLSARLLYNVKVDITYSNEHGSSNRLMICSEGCLILNTNILGLYIEDEIYIKPYLRSMSSMTEEEKEELKTLCSIYIPTDSPTIGFEEYGILVFTHHLTNNTYSFKLNVDIIDWLNKHYFDYRGLIPKGLALEAPKDMYK